MLRSRAPATLPRVCRSFRELNEAGNRGQGYQIPLSKRSVKRAAGRPQIYNTRETPGKIAPVPSVTDLLYNIYSVQKPSELAIVFSLRLISPSLLVCNPNLLRYRKIKKEMARHSETVYSKLQGDEEEGKENQDSSSTMPDPDELPFPASRRERVLKLTNALGFVVLLLIGAFLTFKAWDTVVKLEDKLEQLELGEEVQPQKRCTNPTVRKSWRTLSNDEKMNYIKAVQCLATRPSFINANSTIYDDFTYMHILSGNAGMKFPPLFSPNFLLTIVVHFASGNLPWHRLHLHLHQQALRNECGYKGHQV